DHRQLGPAVRRCDQGKQRPTIWTDMGDQKRTDCKRDKITLYSPQSSQVAEIIRREGVCFSRPEFISKKYGESSPLFLTVYSWFVREAAKIVPPPPGASFPYWAVADPKSVDRSAGGELLVLSVPADQVILFDLYDWNKILQLRPLTDDPQEEKELLQELSLRGLDLNKVMLSSFYPDFREQILASWQRLFRHHQALLQGDCSGVGAVQAALWCIRREWVLQR